MKATCRCGGEWECSVTDERNVAKPIKCLSCGTTDLAMIVARELSVSRDFVSGDHPQNPWRKLWPALVPMPAMPLDKKCHELAEKMVEMTKLLHQVDTRKASSDAEMDGYNALQEAAHDLLGIVNYILTGD